MSSSSSPIEATLSSGEEICESRLFPNVDLPHANIATVTFQIQLVIIYLLTQSLHHGVFKHLGLPALASQITCGILMARKSLLTQHIPIYKTFIYTIFPPQSDSVSASMGMMGYMLALYMIAVKMDFTIMWRSGKKSFMIGIIGLIATGCVVNLTTYLLNHTSTIYGSESKMKDLFTSGTAVSSPHFPVIAILLNDLGLLNSELGRLALSSSLVSEILSISFGFFSTVMARLSVAQKLDPKRVGETLTKLVLGPIALLVVSIVVLRPMARWVVKRTPKDRAVQNVYVRATFFVMMVGAIITDVSSQFVLLGSFIVGAVTPDGPPLGSAVVDMLDFLVCGMLQPFFITTIVMCQDIFNVDFGATLTKCIILLCCVSTGCKLLVCVGYGLYAKIATVDALALGFLMDTKGIVDFGLYIIFMDTGAISNEAAQVLFFYAIITALFTPIAVRFLYHPHRKYAGFQRRDVITYINLRGVRPQELKILSCIYKQNNVFSLINLLEIISPTITSNPVIAYTLHLVKLVGRSHPAFVSHDLQKKKASAGLSFSDDVVATLDRFRNRYNRNNKSTERHMSIHVFTAVSPPKMMHEDICTLALDKLASLIILPFHRKIELDGTITADDRGQRQLNISVLDEAPCSVAVHVDRGGARLNLIDEQQPIIMNSITVESMTRSMSRSRSRSRSTSSSIQAGGGGVDGGGTSSSSNIKFSVAVVYIGGNDDEESLALGMWIAKGGRANLDVVRLLPSGNGGVRKSFEPDVGLLVSEVKRTGLKNGCRYFESRVNSGAETAMLLKDLMSTTMKENAGGGGTTTERYDLVIVGRRKGEDCEQTAGLSEWKEVEELGVVGDLLASGDIKGRTSVLIVQRQRLHRHSHRLAWGL